MRDGGRTHSPLYVLTAQHLYVYKISLQLPRCDNRPRRNLQRNTLKSAVCVSIPMSFPSLVVGEEVNDTLRTILAEKGEYEESVMLYIGELMRLPPVFANLAYFSLPYLPPPLLTNKTTRRDNDDDNSSTFLVGFLRMNPITLYVAVTIHAEVVVLNWQAEWMALGVGGWLYSGWFSQSVSMSAALSFIIVYLCFTRRAVGRYFKGVEHRVTWAERQLLPRDIHGATNQPASKWMQIPLVVRTLVTTHTVTQSSSRISWYSKGAKEPKSSWPNVVNGYA